MTSLILQNWNVLTKFFLLNVLTDEYKNQQIYMRMKLSMYTLSSHGDNYAYAYWECKTATEVKTC
jgi:hypothetical protein